MIDQKPAFHEFKAGHPGRVIPLHLTRPCECGCDARGGLPGVGYLQMTDEHGHGFTLWLKDEATYQSVAASLGPERVEGGFWEWLNAQEASTMTLKEAVEGMLGVLRTMDRGYKPEQILGVLDQWAEKAHEALQREQKGGS